MGIKHLNRYLMNQCSDRSISKRSLSEFAGKVVVIDTSIYLYKFVENGGLVEGLYSMISIFRKHNIIPLFVFDGKPPAEKKELLDKRRREKREAEYKYHELKMQMDDTSSQTAVKELMGEMDALKKQFVRITPAEIQIAKTLMTAYGVSYLESWGESDMLCAYLVRKNYAWACMSDDMDMFLYGCPRVIRHMSMLNHTGVVYETDDVMTELGMTFETFRDIMVLSGTDYNIRENTSLVETLRWYDEYSKTQRELPFYEWLAKNTRYIRDKTHLEKTRAMFDMTMFPSIHNGEIRAIIDRLPFRNRPVETKQLREILTEDGFLFVNP